MPHTYMLEWIHGGQEEVWGIFRCMCVPSRHNLTFHCEDHSQLTAHVLLWQPTAGDGAAWALVPGHFHQHKTEREGCALKLHTRLARTLSHSKTSLLYLTSSFF